MKEKIIRKVKKKRVEDRIQVSKGGSVTRHEFQKEREREKPPRQETSITCSRLYEPKYASGYFRLEERCSGTQK